MTCSAVCSTSTGELHERVCAPFRLARYRSGCEGRISHLKRGYGLRRSRLKGDQGERIWTDWAVLAYNLDTLAIHTT